MAILASAAVSAAAATAASTAAVIGAAASPAALGVARPLLHPGPWSSVPTAPHLRRLPAQLRLPAAWPLRIVASFEPRAAPAAKAATTAAAAASSWATAAFAPGPHAAGLPSLAALLISASRALLDFVRAVAERVGTDMSAPWTAAVAGVGRCLDLYREILLVRCLLTWFPNVPWERQPFSAMRDLCDPFLLLCHRLVPPVFGSTLDISSLLAFTALGILARILSPPAPAAF